MNIKYKKTFNLGNYESETIEVEATDVNLSVESFANVKSLVEDMHEYSVNKDEELKKAKEVCRYCEKYKECTRKEKGKKVCEDYKNNAPF